MGAYFSDLQEDGRKRWYNVVAERHWELQQVAKLYRAPLITRGGISHVEVPVQVRARMSYLEGNAKVKLSGYSTLARDSRATGLGSDYFSVRRVSDDERERRAGSVDRFKSEDKYGGDPDVYRRESKYGDPGVIIHGVDLLQSNTA